MRRRWAVLLLLASAGCSGGAGVPASAPVAHDPGCFLDMTSTSGVRFTYRNGQEADHYTILESLGGGVALLDYDGDGLLDLYVTGGGYFDGPEKKEIRGLANQLYKNLGGWKFQDVTAATGLGGPLFYTHGAAVADYDRDGWPDLLVTGWGRVVLYHNVADGKGGRRFEDVTQAARLTDTLWSTSAAWADLDGDGFPDLYVCHYVDWSWANHPPCKDYREGKLPDVCSPKQFNALPHVHYRNHGDGTFTDVSKAAGLRSDGKGLGVLVVDLDDDGRPDLYVANDTTENFLYLNRGGGKFVEEGLLRAVACDDTGTPNGSMGIDAADYDGSGHLSLFVTNYQYEPHALYRNRGGGQFAFASRSGGIAALGLVYVGFGTGFLDFDRDGAEDLFLTNGHVARTPPTPAEVKQRPILLRNLRKPGDAPFRVRFEDVSSQAGPFFAGVYCGRGCALGDLDNDGRTDLVISHLNEPVVLLQNVLDNGRHWLGIELVGRPYRDAVGAKLTLEVDGQKLVRAVKGGGSYLSANDRRVLFGLGSQPQTGRLTVRWPSGKVQAWDGLASDRYWRLVEREAQAQEVRPRQP